MASFVSLLVPLYLALLRLSSGQCPMSGCDGLRSFSSPVRLLNTTTGVAPPELLWSWEKYRPSGGGCVTNGAGGNARVVCTMAAGQSTSIVSWSPNGRLIWETSLATQVALPLLSYTGEAVVSDGQTLEWLDKDGRSLAPPVRLFPVEGQLLDLTITLSTSIVAMVYRCGFLCTYTVDGIPIAGLWLNDTVGGLSGTFIPLSNPVMNDTRLYLLTAFRPDNNSLQPQQPSHTLLRLYAIDVRSNIVGKFKIVWTYDTPINQTISYIHSKATVCHNSDSRTSAEYSSKSNRERDRQYHTSRDTHSSLSWLTMEAGRLLGVVNFVDSIEHVGSFNLSVRDTGNASSLVSSGYSPNLISSLSWNSTWVTEQHSLLQSWRSTWSTTTRPSPSLPPQPSLPSSFWLSSVPPPGKETVIEELLSLGGGSVGEGVRVSSLLTTPITLVQQAPLLHWDRQTQEGSVPPPLHWDRQTQEGSGQAASDSSAVLVFGTAGGLAGMGGHSGQPQLVGVAVSRGGGGSILWSVSLPHSQPAVGQVATIDLPDSLQSLLVVSTQLGVYGYRLAA